MERQPNLTRDTTVSPYPLSLAKAKLREIFFHESPSSFLEQQVPLYIWNTTITTRRRGKTRELAVPFLDVNPAGSANKPTLLFFPGMFESATSPRPETLAYAHALGMRVITVDYASYGNLKTFLKEFPHFLEEQGVGRDLILSGTSLGGAVAQYVNHLPEFAERTKGMVLSHTAHPSSAPNWGNFRFRMLGVLQATEHVGMPWKTERYLMTTGDRLGGLRTVRPGKDMSELDTAVYQYTLNESRDQHSSLPKFRGRSYIEFALSVTQGSRRPQKSRNFDSTVPVLWLTTKNDPLMFTQSHDGVKKVYPNVTIYEFPSTYGHHTPSCRKEGLVEQIVPFLEKVAA